MIFFVTYMTLCVFLLKAEQICIQYKALLMRKLTYVRETHAHDNKLYLTKEVL